MWMERKSQLERLSEHAIDGDARHVVVSAHRVRQPERVKHNRNVWKQFVADLQEEGECGRRRRHDGIGAAAGILVVEVAAENSGLLVAGKAVRFEVLGEVLDLALSHLI